MQTVGSEWISNALTALTRVVLRFRKSVVVLGLALAVLALEYAGTHLGINTDTANMISPELPWRQDFIRYREGFPVRDRNLVVVVESSSAERSETFAITLARALRAEPQLFDSVFLAGESEFFERNGLLYLSTGELEDLSDRLAAAQPLLGLIKERFSGAGIVSVVERTLDEAADDGSDDRAELDRLYSELAESLEAANAGGSHAIAWQKLITGRSGDSARQLLLIQPELDFDRFQPASAAIERVRAIVEELRRAGPGDVSVRLTGTVAMEHEELVSVTRSASFAGLMALALVTLVLYWTLRSVKALLISVVTLLVGLTYTAAFAGFAVGHLNLLSVAFAVLYVGLGVDFILHIHLRFEELRSRGKDVDTAITETVGGVGTSLVICALTTMAGFFAFIPTSFDGVSELGLISGTGMLISLIVSITLLPALMALFPVRTSIPAPGNWLLGRLSRSWSEQPKLVLGLAAVLALVSLVELPQVTFDSNPIHLRDPQSESVKAIEELAAVGEAPLFDLVAIAPDERVARDWAGALETLPEVREVVTVDSLVPADQEEKQYLLEDIDLLLGPNFANLNVVEPDPEALRGALTELERSLGAQTGEDGVEQALGGALREFLDGLDHSGGANPAGKLLALDRMLRADLPRQLERLADGLQAHPFTSRDLPEELRERWINGRGEALVEIAPVENINDNAAAERFVSSVRSVVGKATGLPVVYTEASKTVVQSFQLAFFYAFIMVSVLLFVFLRRFADVLLVLVPIVFAALVTAAVTVWWGIPFNFANIIALPLLVGVGVDNGIHMVHRMRTEPPKSGEPFRTSTSRAVFACGLTTIASFGNLAFSSHLGMASMGQLLTVGMVTTLVATLIVLPALLRVKVGT